MSLSIVPAARHWHQRLLDLAHDRFGRNDPTLRELDRRTLADIGVNASEIDSIEAESQGRARVTRLRVMVGL